MPFDIPADMMEAAQAAREDLVMAVGEQDEELQEKGTMITNMRAHGRGEERGKRRKERRREERGERRREEERGGERGGGWGGGGEWRTV